MISATHLPLEFHTTWKCTALQTHFLLDQTYWHFCPVGGFELYKLDLLSVPSLHLQSFPPAEYYYVSLITIYGTGLYSSTISNGHCPKFSGIHMTKCFKSGRLPCHYQASEATNSSMMPEPTQPECESI